MSAPQAFKLTLGEARQIAPNLNIHKQSQKSILGEHRSKSACAVALMEGIVKGRVKGINKADIGRIVGMTAQTVHAVQRSKMIDIDWKAVAAANAAANPPKPKAESKKDEKKPAAKKSRKSGSKKPRAKKESAQEAEAPESPAAESSES